MMSDVIIVTYGSLRRDVQLDQKGQRDVDLDSLLDDCLEH